MVGVAHWSDACLSAVINIVLQKQNKTGVGVLCRAVACIEEYIHLVLLCRASGSRVRLTTQITRVLGYTQKLTTLNIPQMPASMPMIVLVSWALISGR